MKKVILVIVAAVFLASCLNDDKPKFGLEFLPIESTITPDTLFFGKVDTIKLKYKLPNNCYSFNDLYYEQKDSTRTVAVRASVQLDVTCSDTSIEKDFKFTVMASQREDYVFRFFKGFNAAGESTFEDVVIPVK